MFLLLVSGRGGDTWFSPACQSRFMVITYHNLDVKYRLNLRALGGDEQWCRAQKLLDSACQIEGFNASIKLGEGAFYGPKLNCH